VGWPLGLTPELEKSAEAIVVEPNRSKMAHQVVSSNCERIAMKGRTLSVFNSIWSVINDTGSFLVYA
jgi:hypothetical protein